MLEQEVQEATLFLVTAPEQLREAAEKVCKEHGVVLMGDRCVVQSEAVAESLLVALGKIGLGTETGSSLAMTPVMSVSPAFEESFSKTIKARSMFHTIIASTLTQSQLNFDFVVLTVVASILAALGLITSNPVVIVASMLVSPIIHPVTCLTVGTVVQDTKMIKKGLFVEVTSLAICILVGVLMGALSTPFLGEMQWPTEEMQSRTTYSGLLLGAAIAFPSGIGIALSVLGKNKGSLVGVAIAASLLPPAVNCGLLWIHALIGEETNRWRVFGYGWTSFGLTALNIALIYLGAMLMFKIKEAAPRTRSGFEPMLDLPRGA